MQNRIAAVQVVDEAGCVRNCCQWLVWIFLRVRNTYAVRSAHRLLVIEVELKLVLFSCIVILKREAIADTIAAGCERVVLSQHIVPQLVFRIVVFEPEVRVGDLLPQICIVSRIPLPEEVLHHARFRLL